MQEKIIWLKSNKYSLSFSKNIINLYRINPLKQIVKIETTELQDYTLNNKYFLLPTPTVIYCIFFNINNQGPGPNPSSFFSQIEVSLNSLIKSSIDVANTIKETLDSILPDVFDTSIINNELTIINKQFGKSLYNYQPRDANTNFNFTIIQNGDDEYSLLKSESSKRTDNAAGIFLYEVLDANLDPLYEDKELVGANLLVNGIFRESKKYKNQQTVIQSNEFEVLDQQFDHWVTL